jgi:hypothetical protein
MSAYRRDQEQAVRAFHRVRDWWESGLLSEEQRDRMAADLDTGLRRTNVFLRGTLFILGFVIANAAVVLLAVLLDSGDRMIWLIAGLGAAAAFAAARMLVARYSLYRFGIEEALAVSSIIFTAVAIGFFADGILDLAGDIPVGLAFLGAAVVTFIVFFEFGFVYAAVIAMASAAIAPFELLESDVARRLTAAAMLAALFAAARLERQRHGDEFPGDSYGIVEAAAWAGIYLVLNLKATSWLSHADESGAFYWATYAAIWMLPVAGLWVAVRERHRLLLDINIALAIATLMSNKPYLNGTRQAWDPIVFGVLMIVVALCVRRWLSSGGDGSRGGFVPVRLLASERERLATAGTASVLQPSLHPQHPPSASEPTIGGGGRSGGAGAGGSF